MENEIEIGWAGLSRLSVKNTGVATELQFAIQHERNVFPVIATLTMPEQGTTFTLSWTEGINEWKEEFQQLSHALMRIAVLTRCAETQWETFFATTNTDVFGYHCEDFLRSEAVSDEVEK